MSFIFIFTVNDPTVFCWKWQKMPLRCCCPLGGQQVRRGTAKSTVSGQSWAQLAGAAVEGLYYTINHLRLFSPSVFCGQQTAPIQLQHKVKTESPRRAARGRLIVLCGTFPKWKCSQTSGNWVRQTEQGRNISHLKYRNSLIKYR